MRQDVTDQALQIGIQHHQAGRLADAERLYRQVLIQDPRHPHALHFLGIIAHQSGRDQAAVELIRQAILIVPGEPSFHCNLGEAYRCLGRFDEAIVAYSHALLLKPDYATAHNNLGIALNETQRSAEAIDSFSRAIQLQPTAEAYNNLGIALAGLGRLNEAVASYTAAIAMKGNYAEAYNNLANVYRHQDKFDDALGAFQRAIQLKPDYAGAYINLGAALVEKGRLEQAVATLSTAVRLAPTDAAALNNLGIALSAQSKRQSAAACFSQAIRLNAGYAEAYYNLANIRKDEGSLDPAIDLYLKAIALKPDYPEAFSNMGNARMDQALLDEALACYDKSMALRRADARLHGNRLYALHYHPDFDAAAILREHLAWNHLHTRPLQAKARPHDNDRSPERRLRIGYVAPDFREHCQSLFTIPLLSHHNHENFEIFCYSGVVSPDAVTERLQSYADGWRSTVGLSDDAVAEMTRRDQIDILVDLTLHMSHNRLLVFARKPAPVQVTWLGYPATTGLGAMDYRFSDPYLDPPEQDEFYAEQTVRLAETFWCYDPLTSEPAVNELPALRTGPITFGCLNNFCKVNPGVLELWSTVLKAVPDSRLMLLASDASHRQRTRDWLETRGIDPARLEFVDYRPRRQYLEHYHRIDIGLDTFPYNGHTTSLDSYWMGVPVVTLAGQTAVGRAGVSQLSNLGLTELIARTAEQYVQIAVALAQDKPALTKLRGELRTRMENSPLMDGGRFAANIESAYRTIWRRWCGGSS